MALSYRGLDNYGGDDGGGGWLSDEDWFQGGVYYRFRVTTTTEAATTEEQGEILTFVFECGCGLWGECPRNNSIKNIK